MIRGLRFITGSGCNYDCFFCHHEGYVKPCSSDVDKEKIYKLYSYAVKEGIKDISITGGEPFLYWDRLKYLLELFGKEPFEITLNTNLTLADKHFDEVKDYSNVEYHVNFSALDSDTHVGIIKKEYLNKLKDNLQLYKSGKSRICLNIPVLKDINTDQLLSIYDYCKENDFKPRFLVLYATSKDNEKYVLDVDGIVSMFPNGIVERKYSYGRYDVTSDLGGFEIVKCLCADMECELCKKTTYLHITPELNIKTCMKDEQEIQIDYSSDETISKSFQKALRRIQ